MGKEIKTSIDINASPEKVWAILIDFANYSTWNPFLKEIKGDPAVGNTIDVKFSNGWVISPKLVAVDERKQLRWKGKLFCGGIFDGEHHFILTEIEGGKTRFDQGESFSGILIPFTSSLLLETEQNFKNMNEAIKTRAEQA
jgi:hypothetical protein